MAAVPRDVPGVNRVLVGLSGGLTEWWHPGEPVPEGALCWWPFRDGIRGEPSRDFPPDPDAEFVEAVYEGPVEVRGTEATR